MNAERIAELRDRPRSVQSPDTEMLDEIERLRGLVVESHSFVCEPDYSPTFHDPTPPTLYPASCGGCMWNYVNIGGEGFDDLGESQEEWVPDEHFDTHEEAIAAHAAHVAALLDGAP